MIANNTHTNFLLRVVFKSVPDRISVSHWNHIGVPRVTVVWSGVPSRSIGVIVVVAGAGGGNRFIV